MKCQKSGIFKKILACTLIGCSVGSMCVTNAYAVERRMGDVNNDGIVSGIDSYMVLKSVAGYISIAEDDVYFTDLSKDGRISAIDALLIQRQAVGYKDSELYAPSKVSLVCGDRTDLNPQVTPYKDNEGISYEYILDGALSSDGSGYPVLKITSNGVIKAFHPGTSVVTIKASNGKETKCTVVVKNESEGYFLRVGNNRLSLARKLQIKNDAYNYSQDISEVEGIVIHSTLESGGTAEEWCDRLNTSGTGSAVHAFVDNTMAYQCLPYEQMGWHAGSNYNKTHIGISICEPKGFYYDTATGEVVSYNVGEQQKYFEDAWRNAVTYSAYLCKEYNLSADDIIGHNEISSENDKGYSDPEHWFKLHGKSMDDFRDDVNTLLNQ